MQKQSEVEKDAGKKEENRDTSDHDDTSHTDTDKSTDDVSTDDIDIDNIDTNDVGTDDVDTNEVSTDDKSTDDVSTDTSTDRDTSSSTDDDIESNCFRMVDLNSTAIEPDGLSWNKAFSRIQDGIDAAFDALKSEEEDHCEVWVSRGTYLIYRDDVLSTIRIQPNVWLLGGFKGDETHRDQRDYHSNQTVLDGEGKVYHVMTSIPQKGKEEIVNVLIDGFTLRGGNANGSQDNQENWLGKHNVGGGIKIVDSNMRLRNLVFENNAANSEGGAIWIAQYGSSVAPKLFVKSSIFKNNSAKSGGAFYQNYALETKFTNCLFVHNQADIASASYSYGSRIPIFTNTTFARNTARETPGVLHSETEYFGRTGEVDYDLDPQTVYVGNCVFAQNKPNRIAAFNAYPVPVYYSLVVDLGPPNNNSILSLLGGIVQGQAEFVNADNGDFRLAPNSLGIDRGTEGSFKLLGNDMKFNAPKNDLLGKPRDNKPDMGAYERQKN